jgi:PLD-like domain
MTIIQVAFPVLRGRRRFHVEKGRRWSLVEHLMLDAVARRPTSAAELAAKSNLPRRVVVEAFIRLMRVGWVEISAGPEGPIFDVTPTGRAQAGENELRAASEDEIIVAVDPNPERLVERFAVVTITDGVVEGLPARANPELQHAVFAKVNEAWNDLKGADAVPPASSAAEPKAKTGRSPAQALFSQDDLIIDGPDHEAALKSVLQRAREEVIIHSTFISEKAAATAFPLLLNAASRGAKVHILWGQDDEKETMSSSRKAVGVLQAAVRESGRSDTIIVHPFTTQSHAKLLIADDGAGRWSAIVGSCNWLSSEFDSFEASIKLRDPELVGECIRHVAAMSLGPPGVWHDWASDLTVLGRRIATLPRGNGRTVPMQLLLSADHSALVLRAFPVGIESERFPTAVA